MLFSKVAFEIAQGKLELLVGCQASTSLPRHAGRAEPSTAGPAGTGDLELLNPSCLGMASEGIQCNMAKDEQLENGEKQRRGALGGGIFFNRLGQSRCKNRSVYPREEVSFSTSSFLNSSLLWAYFFPV